MFVFHERGRADNRAILENFATFSWAYPEHRPPTGIILTLLEYGSGGRLIDLTGVVSGTQTDVYFDAPSAVKQGRVYFVSVGEGGRNTIVQGVTPYVEVQYGTDGGTIDAGQVLRDSIASHLDVVSGVLGVAPGSLTEDLVMQYTLGDRVMADLAIQARALGTAAVTQSKYATQSIPAAAIGYGVIWNAHLDRASANRIAINNADIVSLAAAKITAGTLGAGVIYAGTINANQINAGVISAHVKMTSPELVITSGSFVLNIDEFNAVKVANSSYDSTCRMDGSEFRTWKTSAPLMYSALTAAWLELSDSSTGWVASASPAHLRIDGLPSYYPGPGSKRFWYDPADGNRVKFAA